MTKNKQRFILSFAPVCLAILLFAIYLNSSPQTPKDKISFFALATLISSFSAFRYVSDWRKKRKSDK